LTAFFHLILRTIRRGRAYPGHLANVEENPVFRPLLIAAAAFVACAFPLAASAQSAPAGAPPAAAGPAVVPPGGFAPPRHHHRPDPFIRALARVHLTPAERSQITALLTPAQQTRLNAALARQHPAQ
jgi:Spy/CpxP family protein refolding chaperone